MNVFAWLFLIVCTVLAIGAGIWIFRVEHKSKHRDDSGMEQTGQNEETKQ